MNKCDVVEKINELKLPIGKYVVIGGASLAVRGLRETKDLDILVMPDLFDELSSHFDSDPVYESRWNRKRLKGDNLEIYPDLYLEKKNMFFNIEEIIKEAEFVGDIPLQPINNLLICKLDSGKEKDLQDIELIKQFVLS